MFICGSSMFTPPYNLSIRPQFQIPRNNHGSGVSSLTAANTPRDQCVRGDRKVTTVSQENGSMIGRPVMSELSSRYVSSVCVVLTLD